jgi:hypothetical protein
MATSMGKQSSKTFWVGSGFFQFERFGKDLCKDLNADLSQRPTKMPNVRLGKTNNAKKFCTNGHLGVKFVTKETLQRAKTGKLSCTAIRHV